MIVYREECTYVGFEFSILDYTICDLPHVKVIRGFLQSSDRRPFVAFFAIDQVQGIVKYCNPRRHRGGDATPLYFFLANNSRKKRPIAKKLSALELINFTFSSRLLGEPQLTLTMAMEIA